MKKILLFKLVVMLWLVSFTLVATAWGLQNLSLKVRVEKSHLIVVGSILEITLDKESDIAGVGNCYEGTSKIKKFLKGNSKGKITITWCDSDASELLSYRRKNGPIYPDKTYPFTEAIWMLGEKYEESKYTIAGNMAGILPLIKLEKVKNIISEAVDK